jgi:hypothetical protein
MSHVAKYGTGIKNPNMGLLGFVCGQVASSLKGRCEVKGTVARGYGHNKVVDFALFTDGMRDGMGVQVNAQGELEFISDDFGQKDAQKIRDLVKQYYISAATIQALQELGYIVSSEINEQTGNVFVSAEGG